jgi:hypothetical protein
MPNTHWLYPDAYRQPPPNKAKKTSESIGRIEEKAMKTEITKSVLGVVLGLSVFGVMPSEAQAQSSRSNTQTIADEQKRTGITTFYYAHKYQRRR